jgi:rSAM/selenodomain-associated transferase 1
VAVLARSPVPGRAKTRLIPLLGPAGAARLHRELVRRTIGTALAARLGPVVLWCAPDPRHPFFRALQRATGLPCRAQPDGDLGARMHAAFVADAAAGPLLLLGTDCPPLTPAHLARASQALHAGHDAAFLPAEDGGYVLVGLRRPQPALFADMPWGSETVMARTRERAACLGLHVWEGQTLWDVDRPEDVARYSAWQGDGLHPPAA